MTRIRDVKSEIENLEITMNEAITIQVLNSLDSSFAKFLGILSHETREKNKLSTLENLVKSLEDKELRMKNHDKATANYEKQFTKKKGKFSGVQIEDSEDFATSSSSKCKFGEKKYGPNECWQFQAECYYCHDVGNIAKFCKKKSTPRTNSPPKELITCTRRVPSHVDY